jgi:hypothetical protein
MEREARSKDFIIKLNAQWKRISNIGHPIMNFEGTAYIIVVCSLFYIRCSIFDIYNLVPACPVYGVRSKGKE